MLLLLLLRLLPSSLLLRSPRRLAVKGLLVSSLLRLLVSSLIPIRIHLGRGREREKREGEGGKMAVRDFLTKAQALLENG